MLEQYCTVVVLKKAASEVLTNSPQQKHNVPGWNKDVRSLLETTKKKLNETVNLSL